MKTWSFEWCSEGGRTGAFIPEALWKTVQTQSSNARVFSELSLIDSWVKTKGFAVNAELHFCVARSGERLIALLPFCSVPATWRNIWHHRLIGVGEPHFDYQHPLFSEELADADRNAFWDDLEMFLENHSHFDSAMLLRLTNDVGPAGAVADDSVESPYINMCSYQSWDSFLQSRSSNHRTDVRRRIRRLEEQGPLGLTIYDKQSQQTDVMQELDNLRRAYEDLWEGQPSGGLFRMPGTWEFYEEFVPEMLKAGMLHASILTLNGQPISWHFGFLHRQILHWYKPTYLKSMNEFSPGKVHLAFLLKHGFSEGWREFDFGCGTEEYKYRWADGVRPLVKWHWRSRRWQARLRRSVREILSSIVHYKR
jgi:CelD/BcsL family acetyltransferase involved in cellulose biosynthesis